MKYLLIAFFFIILFNNCKSTEFSQKIQLEKGDLLFQDIDCGEYCESIESVTQGYRGSKFSHIAILDIVDNEYKVIEAVNEGVRVITLEKFLGRSGKVIVGRMKDEYKPLINKALRFSKSKVGSPYDDVFDIDNEKYYCSELIYFAFKSSNEGYDVFELKPMTFKAPNSQNIFPIWQKYFDIMKEKVPEGRLGLNPGSISLSDKITIVKVYKKPDGWK
jgi:uncharacterized protein YycO